MRFIYSLALAQLYVVVISQELQFDEYNTCEIGLWVISNPYDFFLNSHWRNNSHFSNADLDSSV